MEEKISLKSLPVETVYHALENMSVRSILRLGSTSKRYYQITHDNYLWYKLLNRDYYYDYINKSYPYIFENQLETRYINRYYDDEKYLDQYIALWTELEDLRWDNYSFDEDDLIFDPYKVDNILKFLFVTDFFSENDINDIYFHIEKYNNILLAKYLGISPYEIDYIGDDSTKVLEDSGVIYTLFSKNKDDRLLYYLELGLLTPDDYISHEHSYLPLIYMSIIREDVHNFKLLLSKGANIHLKEKDEDGIDIHDINYYIKNYDKKGEFKNILED